MNYRREAEEVLNNYKDLIHAVENLKEQIEIKTEQMEYIKGNIITDMPKGGKNDSEDILLNHIYEKSEIEKNYKLTKKTINHIKKVIEHIKKHYEVEGRILEFLYIENKKMSEIEKLEGISNRHLYRLKNRAVKIFAVKYFGIRVIQN